MSRDKTHATTQQHDEAGLKRLCTVTFVAAVAGLGLAAALATHDWNDGTANVQAGQGASHPAQHALNPAPGYR